MALRPDTRLGPYTIVEPLGAGGMGEVYRATDINLGRQVAIKVLPEAFTQDAERVARFEREARTLASLSHPNIAIVHGLEKSGGTLALVMELVEGPTLADRIAHGPIPVAETLAVARQIAEALEAAHEQGIVHRDLKPANVKVKADGTAKVLDFGLAKALDAGAQSSPAHPLSLSPTITTPAMTQAGVIMGTAAYMSPEQARGTAVDRRSDVWAFGCLVYEMLTGKAVFDGTTVSDVLAGVLRADPDWRRLPPSVHPRLRLMLERCLERDPRSRYQGIGDARVDIDAVLRDPLGTSAAVPSHAQPSARRPSVLALAGAIGGILAMAAILLLFRPGNTNDPSIIRLGIAPPEGAMFDASESGAVPFAVSPTAPAIAFVVRAPGERSRLWVQSLDAERPRLLQGTDGALSPFWSPDGDWIAFYADGNLKKVRLSGGEPETITATKYTGTGGSAWSTDDTILLKSGRFEAAWLKVSARGGSVSEVTRLGKGEQAHLWPTFLPDGQHFVHYVRNDNGSNGIYLASLDGSPPRLLLTLSDKSSERGLGYVPGFLLFVRAGALMARRFDDTRVAVLDEEFRLAEGILACCGSWDPWSVSGGVIAFWRNPVGFDTVFRWYSRDGTFTNGIDKPGRYVGFSVSPDGGRVAFSRFLDAGHRDIWVRDTTRDVETRLTFDGDSFSPVWSPKGTEIAFSSARAHVPDVFVTSAAGGGSDAARAATPPTIALEIPGSWTTADDIVYMSENPEARSELHRVHLADRKDTVLPLSGPYSIGAPRVSPDGKWIAYVTDASGQPEVWLASYPTGENRVPASRGGGIMPAWRTSDGRELYYMSLDQRLMAVSVTPNLPSLEVGPPQLVLRVADMAHVDGRSWDNAPYAAAADGRRFLIQTLAPGVQQPPVQVIVNWQALLKK